MEPQRRLREHAHTQDQDANVASARAPQESPPEHQAEDRAAASRLSQVQLRRHAGAHEESRAPDVLEAAQTGFDGPGSTLPHGDRIQQAFGDHDVSGVRAFVGAGAAAASERIGAEAYAAGERIAFRSTPDLHTAAHEAAHVVQQRNGVQVEGGVGRAGDAHEHQADRVADAVVAGKSAQPILGSVGGGAPTTAVQKKEGGGLGEIFGDAFAKGGGLLTGPVVAAPDKGPDADDPLEWDAVRDVTAASFLKVLMKANNAATFWTLGDATLEDPPSPSWTDMLIAIGGIALTGITGGLGALVTAAKVASDASKVVRFSWNAAVLAGRKVVSDGYGGIVGMASAQAGGNAKKLALYSFGLQQANALSDAAFAAQSAFIEGSVEGGKRKLSIAEMRTIQATNELAANRAVEVTRSNLLVGWMNLLGGKDAIAPADLNDLDNKGTLGIEIVGRGSLPQYISRAKADGLGPGLRAQLSGTRVGDWIGTKTKGAIDLVVTTRQNDYLLSEADRKALNDKDKFGDDMEDFQDQFAANIVQTAKLSTRLAAYRYEQTRQIPEYGAMMGSINFGVGRRRDGSFEYISNFGGWWMDDTSAGYTAGRYFLREMHSFSWLIDQVRNLKLPDVE